MEKENSQKKGMRAEEQGTIEDTLWNVEGGPVVSLASNG